MCIRESEEKSINYFTTQDTIMDDFDIVSIVSEDHQIHCVGMVINLYQNVQTAELNLTNNE